VLNFYINKNLTAEIDRPQLLLDLVAFGSRLTPHDCKIGATCINNSLIICYFNRNFVVLDFMLFVPTGHTCS